MQEYMDSMQHYLGASCEVLKLNNNFYLPVLSTSMMPARTN